MVGQVRPLAPRRQIPAIPPKPTGGGGAAAQRRLNYQMAMSKLESDGFAKPAPDATQPTSPVASSNSNSKEGKKSTKVPAGTSSASRSIGSGSGGGGSKRKPRSINSKIKTTDDIDWGMTDDDGWPAFEEIQNRVLWNFNASKTASTTTTSCRRHQRTPTPPPPPVKPFSKKVYYT